MNAPMLALLKWCFARRRLLCLVMVTTFLRVAAFAQVPQDQPKDLKTSIARVQAGDFIDSDLRTVADAGAAKQVLPQLEHQFVADTDVPKRTFIASALVRLGDKDDTYWNFLLQQATAAVGSDIPDPFRDSTGHATGRELSPDFRAWIQAHDIDVSTAINSVMFDSPGKVLLLAGTGDPRSIPLLRRALKSHNYQIVAWAAKGLVQAQDKQSIPLIITAIQNAPPEYHLLIAESLVFFDDVLAQNAVDSYMPKKGPHWTARKDRVGEESSAGRRSV